MDAFIQALIDLHRGVGREGPGDSAFSRQILAGLPPLPSKPRIVDLGCGSGAAALLLAEHFDVPVTAVDIAEPFLDDMMDKARARRLADRIHPLASDFACLSMEPGSIDLLWSEGAAYNLTFAGAVETWRPLMATNGLAVISELTWFANNPPDEPRSYWGKTYQSMADETENICHARAAGFDVVSTRRLPTQAWWTNYYDPMLERMAAVADPDSTMQSVIDEMETEIDLFRRYSDHYGYVFYVLLATRPLLPS